MLNGIFIKVSNLEDFNSMKTPVSPDNNTYQLGGVGDIYEGEPDMPYLALAFIKDPGIIWALGNFYGRCDLSNLISDEDFAPVVNAAYGSILKNSLATLNGQSLEAGGDITIDMSLYKIVSALPTENIQDNKIYMIPSSGTNNETTFAEYIWTGDKWDQLGVYKATVDLSGYMKTTDADKKYMTKTTSSGSSTSQLSISSTGAFNNYGNNGQAFNAVRDFGNEPNNTKWKGALGSGYKIDAASFGVKDNGTTAFSHKKYETFNKETGAYTGAKNTAVLVFSGNTGLMYAKNTGTSSDVTDAMYKYVGIIDSPDSAQKVYSSTLIDNQITTTTNIINTINTNTHELINILLNRIDALEKQNKDLMEKIKLLADVCSISEEELDNTDSSDAEIENTLIPELQEASKQLINTMATTVINAAN